MTQAELILAIDESSLTSNQKVIIKTVAKNSSVNLGAAAPVSKTAPGTAGEVRITSTFIYYCVTDNNWVRIAVDGTWV